MAETSVEAVEASAVVVAAAVVAFEVAAAFEAAAVVAFVEAVEVIGVGLVVVEEAVAAEVEVFGATLTWRLPTRLLSLLT